MPVTVQHVLSATTPDDPAYEIRPSAWNSAHAMTLALDNTEVIKWASAGANSISSGTLQFSNLNGVSFGMDANGVVTGSIAAGVPSPVNFSAGTRSADLGSIVFNDANGISFGLGGVGSSAMTASHNGLTTAMASNAGSNFMGTNTALTANGVSMTANSSGLSLNFPAFLTTAQAPGAYLTTARASNDAIGLNSALTANGVSVTANSSGLSLNFPAFLTTAQAPGAYLTTARASNDAIGLNSALTANGVSVTANSSGLSLNFPAFLTTAALSQNTSNYAGLSTGFAGTNISGSMTMNTAGLNIALSVAAPGGGGGIGIAAGTRTATTANTLLFDNANGITFGLDAVGGSIMTASHNALTTARASNDAIGLNSALTANGVSVTANSSGLSLNFPAFLTTAQPVGAYLTTARASNDAIGLNSALTANGVSVTANSSGLSLNFPAFLTTAALSGDTTKYAGLGTTFNGANISGSMTMNTAGLQLSMSVAAPGGGGGIGIAAGTRTATTANTLLFDNANGVTFGLNAVAGSIMTASVAAQSVQAMNMYAVSNTTGASSSSTMDARSISFQGAGIASVGFTNGSVVISVPAGGGAGDGYNIVSMMSSTSGGGTAGATFSNSAASIGLMAGSNITLSQTSNTIVFNAPNASSLVGGSNITISTAGSTISVNGYGGVTMNNWRVFPLGNNTTFSSLGQNSVYLQHFIPEDVLQFSNIEIYARGSFASSTNAKTYAQTIKYGIYSQGTGTNATSMSLMSSSQILFTASFNSNTAYGFTISQGAGSFTTTSGGTGVVTNISGAFHQYMPFTATLNPNVKYAVGMLISSSTAGAAGAWAFAPLAMTNMTSNMARMYVSTTNAVSNNVVGDREMGVYQTTTGALPNTYATTNLAIAISRQNIYMQFE